LAFTLRAFLSDFFFAMLLLLMRGGIDFRPQ
jgi:hypothetical protein